MKADPRWERVQALFDTASTWPGSERAGRLARIEADPDIRREVLSLLEAAHAEGQAAEQARKLAKTPGPVPESIGPYRVLRMAGAGGRGVVYEAEREIAGGIQRVAVKRMLDHLVAPEDLDRFEREQRMLLRLAHPGIARFIGAGWDETQRPYLALEWIDGVPIDQYCRDHDLPAQARIRLVIQVLEALQAAHRALVVHLDLKPSNILVDGAGQVRILDFGSAKLLAGEDATATQQMTPRYASPERLRADPVTTGCDLYSAALVLHEVLTGELPFRDVHSIAGLGERAMGNAALRVLARDPDLKAILERALEFRPEDRYESASRFAEDLSAYLEQRPVKARRATPWYAAKKWILRHPRGVAAGVAVALLLGAFAGYAAWQQSLRNQAAARSEAVAAFLQWMITSSATPGSGRPAMTVLEMVERGNRRLERGAAELPDDVAAALQANFAFLTQEFGKESAAEPMARAAFAKAERSGDPQARLITRGTLATLLLRRGGTCEEAARLFQSGDPLFTSGRFRTPLVDYAVARSNFESRCQLKPAAAIEWIEKAIAMAEQVPAARLGVEPAIHRAGLYVDQALLLAQAGRRADALKAANAGLALAGSHPDGRYFQVALLRIRSQAYVAASDPAKALADAREAARLAPGVVNPFEEVRLRTMLAGRLADAGQFELARETVGRAVADARTRRAAIGPSYWMILADGAEALGRCQDCAGMAALYVEAGGARQGPAPRAWQGNQQFYEAECAAIRQDAAGAARLARQALDTYGELLSPGSKRRKRLQELISGAH
jgi:serine/threonine-protein kinase